MSMSMILDNVARNTTSAVINEGKAEIQANGGLSKTVEKQKTFWDSLGDFFKPMGTFLGNSMEAAKDSIFGKDGQGLGNLLAGGLGLSGGNGASIMSSGSNLLGNIGGGNLSGMLGGIGFNWGTLLLVAVAIIGGLNANSKEEKKEDRSNYSNPRYDGSNGYNYGRNSYNSYGYNSYDRRENNPYNPDIVDKEIGVREDVIAKQKDIIDDQKKTITKYEAALTLLNQNLDKMTTVSNDLLQENGKYKNLLNMLYSGTNTGTNYLNNYNINNRVNNGNSLYF